MAISSLEFTLLLLVALANLSLAHHEPLRLEKACNRNDFKLHCNDSSTYGQCAAYVCSPACRREVPLNDSCCKAFKARDILECISRKAEQGKESSLLASIESRQSVVNAQGSTACASWSKIFTSCEHETTGFQTLSVVEQASCYCYSSSTFAPYIYDNYFDDCQHFLFSLYPSSLSSVSAHFIPSPCSVIGNVRHVTAVQTAPPTSASTTTGLLSHSKTTSLTGATPASKQTMPHSPMKTGGQVRNQTPLLPMISTLLLLIPWIYL